MRGDDNGRAFLRVMRSADQSPAKQALYRGVVGDRSRPVQVIWAADDPALALASYGEKARRAAHLDALTRIGGKHFPQEDQAGLIASHIAGLVATVGTAADGEGFMHLHDSLASRGNVVGIYRLTTASNSRRFLTSRRVRSAMPGDKAP